MSTPLAYDDHPYAGKILLPEGGQITHDTLNKGRRNGEPAACPPHLLVSAPTGSGKTRGVLAASAVSWGDRPLVCVSSKGDLAELTIRERAKSGPVYLLDLSGEVRESELKGVPVTRVYFDPCALIHSNDSANDMAGMLIGISNAIGGGGSGDGRLWEDNASAAFAALLRAGGTFPHPATGDPVWGGGMRWVSDAIADPGPDAAPEEDEDEGDDEDEDDYGDLLTPNWDAAYLRSLLQGSRHAPQLLAAKRTNPRTRDSFMLNMKSAAISWTYDAVTDSTGKLPFRPAMLEEPGATFYIVSPGPPKKSANVAALALMTIVDHWRLRVDDIEPVLFIIDELANGAPIPGRTFNAWIGEGRGLGIRVCAAVQASSQFSMIWSDREMKALRDTMPATLILPDAPEEELLERAIKLRKTQERSTGSVGDGGTVTMSRDTRPTVSVGDLMPTEPGTGRLTIGRREGVLVELPDLSKVLFSG